MGRGREGREMKQWGEQRRVIKDVHDAEEVKETVKMQMVGGRCAGKKNRGQKQRERGRRGDVDEG